MYALLNVAFALLAGLLMTRIFSRWHLPDVTAFLVAGVLIGPFCLGRLGLVGVGFPDYESVAALGTLSDVAMGFIAFAIGNEFRLEDLRKTGRQAFVIGVVQALAAAVLVDLALLAFHFLRPDLLTAPAAITLGAIATATAPAATLMVVRQYKAKGPLTSLLLPIVALDDAVGLVVFAVSFGVAKAMISGALSIVSVLVNPLVEIVLSLLLGMLAGIVLTWLEAMFHSNRNRMSVTIGFVVLTVALSRLEWELGEVIVGFSPLLVCMMLGTVFCNICPLSEDLMDRADDWSAPLLAVFFVISGAELRLEVFGELTMVLVGVVYIIFRSAGKYFGARFSAKAVGCDEKTVKYLGITLLPQAGVALGMCVSAQALGAADGLLVRNIVLFSVLIYELVGPLLTKEALTAAGEITAKPREVIERRAKALAEAGPKEFLEEREERKQKKQKYREERRKLRLSSLFSCSVKLQRALALRQHLADDGAPRRERTEPFEQLLRVRARQRHEQPARGLRIGGKVEPCALRAVEHAQLRLDIVAVAVRAARHDAHVGQLLRLRQQRQRHAVQPYGNI